MKCRKVKNPCKICFDPVSKKNGLQCQGACQKWAHYKCLNYTPGKIQDIKAGIIKITCPCPDCSTSEPKEELANPPFTCTNSKCPANRLPVCSSRECPTNDNPIPTYPAPPYTPNSTAVDKSSSPPRPLRRRSCPTSPCPSPPRRTPSPPKCPPNCPSRLRMKKPVPENIISPKLAQSCSLLSTALVGQEICIEAKTVVSDSELPKMGGDQKIIITTIQDLCNTVGQLTTQLQDLMCKFNKG